MAHNPSTGSVPPAQPVFENGGMTDFSSYQIEWVVPLVVYSPEIYVVMYGTSEGALDLMSDAVQGSSDITATNEHYSVVLRNLDLETTYHFQIVATNSFESTSTNTLTFTTQSGTLCTIPL